MSVDYAASLSPYDNKGKCGQPEVFEDEGSVREKCRQLAKFIRDGSHVVVHTGAGISTSAGIPDFRGPKGVWTLEKRGESLHTAVTFETAQPTYTHLALLKLHRAGLVHFIVSQNVDGLHLRSGFPRGQMRDTVLDWEDDLPEPDFDNAVQNSKKADLSLCLGTTLQIVPAGNLPLQALKQPNGKLVICNLQPTKHDKKASLLIHARVDDIMSHVLDFLGLADGMVKSESSGTATAPSSSAPLPQPAVASAATSSVTTPTVTSAASAATPSVTKPAVASSGNAASRRDAVPKKKTDTT